MITAIIAVLFALAVLLFAHVARRASRNSKNWKKGYKYEQNQPRLSRPQSDLKSSYDVVVIGSGYGGGVAASRSARAGKSVCVLEQGAEKWPGEYPCTATEAMQEYGVTGRVLGRNVQIGRKAGLFRTIRGEGQDVFIGCGLGGTSLINAGVFLQPDERILQGTDWPEDIRKSGLSRYFKRAKHMLSPTPYPSSYPTPTKLSVLEDQARQIGLHSSFYRPPLTTSFTHDSNNAGVSMRANSNSGNECMGNNDFSKQSVLTTYLADAWANGAEMFCGIDVKYVKKRDQTGGYIVFFDSPSTQGGKTLSWVVANEIVFMGAGAIGTPSILLRSRLHGLSTSPLLGQKLTGNGDMLNFAYNCDQELNSVGHKTRNGCGPTITGCIDLRGPEHTSEDARDGFIIQDGCIPAALAPAIQTYLDTRARSGIPRSYRDVSKLLARMKSYVLGAYAKNGSVNRTMVFLTMSHDEDQGTITLEKDQTVVRWEGASTIGQRTSRVQSLLQRMTESLGGTFVDSPGKTVHPLGGASMSADGTGLGGVVDHRGAVFNGEGVSTHDGLYCVDGSVMPTSLGVNPCATITALAERTCDLIGKQRGWQSDERTHNNLGGATFSIPTHAQRTSHAQPNLVRFDETMQGFIQPDTDFGNFETAKSAGQAGASSTCLDLRVAVRPDAHNRFLGQPTGTFSCGTLSREPLLVINGSVELFVADESVSDAKRMVYQLELISTAGETYSLHGYKVIDPNVTLSVMRTWRATTTLDTTITDSTGKIVGKGVLHLSLPGFLSELRSLYSLNHFWPCMRFLSFFAGQIAAYFFAPFRPLEEFEASTKDHFAKPAPLRKIITVKDGVAVPLKLWLPPSHVIEKSMPILLIPGASVNEQLFSIPTIPVNLIDYLTSLGYRCYVPITRIGAGENARYGYTCYDARLDVRAAVEYVYQEERKKIYVVSHCVGSITTAIALLTGEVNANMIAGMTVSQVFAHIKYSPFNDFKARRPWMISLYETLSSTPWFYISSTSPVRILDTLLRFYPVGSRREICRSAVCHRIDVPFGRCWTHSNLNRATHTHLDQLFDGVHTHFLRQLTKMGVNAPYHVHTNLPDFADLGTPENFLRLKDIKISFLYGAENAVWSSQATKTSYDALRAAFPNGQYERNIVKEYGHMDCLIGKDAYKDVYPRVQRHITACQEKTQDDYAGMETRRDSGFL